MFREFILHIYDVSIDSFNLHTPQYQLQNRVHVLPSGIINTWYTVHIQCCRGCNYVHLITIRVEKILSQEIQAAARKLL